MALGLDMRKHGVQSLLVHCSLYRRDAARDLLDETRGCTSWFAFTMDFTRIILRQIRIGIILRLLCIVHPSLSLISLFDSLIDESSSPMVTQSARYAGRRDSAELKPP
jgi:hypothetical protein